MTMLRTYFLEAKCELLKLLRSPSYALPTLAAPLMFYIFFGVLFGAQHAAGTTLSRYMLATYGAFGIMGASLFSFGVGIAVERAQGWLLLKRASPMPPLAYFTARVIACAIVGAIIVLELAIAGSAFGGVRMPVATWAALFAILVAGTVPFCAIGLAVGSMARPNAAPGIVNLLYLPMGFLAGLWIPIQLLPDVIRHIAPVLPGYHLGQLALGTIGAGEGVWWVHVTVLAAYALVGVALAALAFRRSEERVYG